MLPRKYLLTSLFALFAGGECQGLRREKRKVLLDVVRESNPAQKRERTSFPWMPKQGRPRRNCVGWSGSRRELWRVYVLTAVEHACETGNTQRKHDSIVLKLLYYKRCVYRRESEAGGFFCFSNLSPLITVRIDSAESSSERRASSFCSGKDGRRRGRCLPSI